MSMIPIIFTRIQACLSLARVEHLSNEEECNLTTELVGQFQKLNRFVLTFPEKKLIRRRLALFRKKTAFYNLNQHLMQQQPYALKWHKGLSFSSNILLNIGGVFRSQALSLSALDIKRWLSKSHMRFGNNTYFYILTPSSVYKSMLSPMFADIIQKISMRDIQSIVLPTTWIQDNSVDVIVPYLHTCITKGLKCIVFDITFDSHLDDVTHLIQFLLLKYPQVKSGISINLSNRNCIKQVEHILNTLDFDCYSRFILRLSQGNFLHNKVHTDNLMNDPKQCILKDLSFSKWSLFTILKRLKTTDIRCHIRCHYLYDLAWGLVIRSNLMLENKVFFESDILNYPHLGKLLYMLNKSSVHRSPYIPALSTMDTINIALSHLNHRSYSINARSLAGSEPFLFKTTHRRFFRYLSRNFLSYYKRTQTNV